MCHEYFPLGNSRHQALRQAQRTANELSEGRGCRSGRQVEAMAAEQAEVMGQNVAIERFA
jgi:hypothetical protein